MSSKELWLQAALWLKDLGVIDPKNTCFAKGARVYDLALALQVRSVRKELCGQPLPLFAPVAFYCTTVKAIHSGVTLVALERWSVVVCPTHTSLSWL